MANLWPWLVLAGAGALHGLNPATGWLLAAGCGLRSGDRRQVLRALLPIATGHVASVALTMLATVGLAAVGAIRGYGEVRRWSRIRRSSGHDGRWR